MTQQIKKTQKNISILIKLLSKRTVAVFVSSTVLFFSFFYITPDYKLIQNHKQISFGINHVFAQGDSGGDGGGDGDGDSGGDGDGDSGGDGDGGDSGGDSSAGGDSGGGGYGDSGGDAEGSSSGDSGDGISISSSDSVGTTIWVTGSTGDSGGAGDSGVSGDSGDGGTPASTGGVGGGGGINSPTVTVDSSGFPVAGEQPLSFITLSQIPYTGFKAGTLMASIYWTVLILVSGIIAYSLLIKKVGAKLLYALRHTFGNDNAYVVEEDEEELIINEQINTTQEDSFSLSSTKYEGMATDAIILKTDTNGRSPRLELKRTGVVKKDTVETPFISESVVNTSVSKNNFQNTSNNVLHSITEVIRIIKQGDINSFLEMIKKYRKGDETVQRDLSEILVQMLCEMDRLYARRIGEGESLKDESVEDIFKNWGDKDIEQLVYILSIGINQNYSTQHTSAKMAFLRALEYAQEVRE